MRKTAAALITLGLAALALTGCAGGPSFAGNSCPTQTGAPDFASSVAVKGDFGAAPDVTVSTPTRASKLSVDDLIVGKGTAVTSAHQPLVVDIALYSAKTGRKLVATDFNGDLSRVGDVESWASQAKGIGAALQCATAGSRLLVGIPHAQVSDALAQGVNLAADDSVVAVMDVLKVYLPRAEGSLVYNDALGLPTVVRAPDGRPGIIVPDAKKPSSLVVQTLLHGDGTAITKGDAVRVQFTEVDWDTRKVLKTTWGEQSVRFTETDLGEVFDKGLVGKTVGSQVMIVVPAADGQASSADGSGGTQVLVIDILGIDAPSSSGQ